jgi:Cu-Zn family superoxide dismutase
VLGHGLLLVDLGSLDHRLVAQDADLNHPYHMGDLPNLEAGPDGVGRLKARTTRVTLSDGPLSVFDADGTALIIHANPDQGISGEPKSGVAGGPRAACGVIVKK